MILFLALKMSTSASNTNNKEKKYFSSDDETYGDSISTFDVEINNFVNTVIKYIHKIKGATIDVRNPDGNTIPPEWFDGVKIDIDYESKSYLTDGINEALKKKSIYDEYYYNHRDDEDIYDYKYPSLAEYTYMDVLQMLADEFTTLNVNVENASDEIEDLSDVLIQYFKNNVNENTNIESLTPKMHEYFDAILNEANNYSILNNITHEVGFEINRSDRGDELLEHRYYVLSEHPNNEGWWSVERDISDLIEELENEIEDNICDTYKRYSQRTYNYYDYIDN